MIRLSTPLARLALATLMAVAMGCATDSKSKKRRSSGHDIYFPGATKQDSVFPKADRTDYRRGYGVGRPPYYRY